MKKISKRIELTTPAWLKEAVVREAREKGVSMSEYIKDAMKRAVQEPYVKGKETGGDRPG